MNKNRKRFESFIEEWSTKVAGVPGQLNADFDDLLWKCWLGGAETPLALLRDMVTAQHAGQITDEMYAAWDAARKYLEQEAT